MKDSNNGNQGAALANDELVGARKQYETPCIEQSGSFEKLVLGCNFLLTGCEFTPPPRS